MAIVPSLEEFLKLCKRGNVIPVYKEINVDLDTPVSAFLKINRGDYAFLLESVEGQEKIARYSFLGSNPSFIFKSKGRKVELIYPHKNTRRSFESKLGGLEEVRSIMRPFKSVEVKGLPRFFGGLVGFIGYDTVRSFEEIPDKNPDDLNTPDILLMLTDTILIFDHVNHTIKIVANVLLPLNKTPGRKECVRLYSGALSKIAKIEQLLGARLTQTLLKSAKSGKVASNFTKAGFEGIVKKAKEHIKKGDIIQVVLSQRFKVATSKDPFAIYRSLRSLNPSPYMFFLKMKDFCLAGASPEMLVRCESGAIETRPIAGTRRRGTSEEEDNALAKELIADPKEKAEHLMLVDLGRNDLGRISVPGTVRVGEFMVVERYSHVMHLVSEVKGKLDKKRFDVYSVLQSAFPAGTVSGSPKIRAMQIIDELEKTRRGPYAGCVGYFSFSHNMDTCITIRTVLIHNGKAYVQAGAGIVADSVAKKEYAETVNKAKALVEAITK